MAYEIATLAIVVVILIPLIHIIINIKSPEPDEDGKFTTKTDGTTGRDNTREVRQTDDRSRSRKDTSN